MRIPLPSTEGDHQGHCPIYQQRNGSGNVGGVIIHAVVHHVGCKGDERSSSHGGPGETIGSAGKAACFMEHSQYHDFHEGPENEKDEFCGRFPAEKFDGTGKKDEIYQKGQSQEGGRGRP